MNLDEDMLALKARFEEAGALNRQALQALREGQSLQALESLFKRKETLVAELQVLQAELDRQGPLGDQDALQAAFRAQREAATSEAQLSEALGKIVPQSGNAVSAYERFTLDKPISKLDSSV